jgi:TolB-like protein
MTKFSVLIALIFGIGSVALGQVANPSGPQVSKVLIIPFGVGGNSAGQDWVAGAIEGGLRAQAAADRAVQVMGMSGPVNGGVAGALAAAKNAGASLVVFGYCDLSSTQLSVTGQLVDVSSGHMVTSLSATGSIDDLTKIENALSNQLAAVLPPGPASAPAQAPNPPDQQATAPNPAPNPPIQVSPAPPPPQVYVYSTPYYSPPPTYPYSYTYPQYSYPTYPAYPDYYYSAPYYGYPYAGVPFYFYGGLGFGYGHGFYSHGGYGYGGGGFHGGGFGGRGGIGGGHGGGRR